MLTSKGRKRGLYHVREAYEYSFYLLEVFKGQGAHMPISGTGGEVMLLFRLGSFSDNAKKVEEVAGLEHLPVEQERVSETGMVKCRLLDKDAQKKLGKWLMR
ncbi:hypothetical protein G6011_11157 [Alternaria panax]|uniref:Uncharacterized protein n=1 Tax=Alternaria panax TaxID=48097 RepID=A0AAD4ID00_9PLEO|nr:hypothetical protein G6011_11157 [Alternaria panax]